MLDKLGVFLCSSSSVEERGWVWACLEGWEGRALWGGRVCEHSVFGVWWGNNKAIVVFGGREGGREKEEERRHQRFRSLSLARSLPCPVARLLPLKIHLPNGRPGDEDV